MTLVGYFSDGTKSQDFNADAVQEYSPNPELFAIYDSTTNKVYGYFVKAMLDYVTVS